MSSAGSQSFGHSSSLNANVKVNLNVETGTGAWLGFWRPGVTIHSQLQSLRDKTAKRLAFFDRKTLSALVLVSCIAVYVYLLHAPDAAPVTLYDEAWLGKAVNSYLRKQFFISYPAFPYVAAQIMYPFMKAIGYNGDFPFIASGVPFDLSRTDIPSDISQSYYYPYLLSRILSRSIGVLNVIITYLCLKISGISLDSCLLGGLMLIFEGTFLTSTRYSLTATLNLSVILFYNFIKSYSILRPDSIVCLVLMGVCSGLASATGEFGTPLLVLTIGERLYRVWWLISDSKRSYLKVFLRFVGECMILCVLTAMILTCFVCNHIRLTPLMGPDDRRMSGKFQSSLQGSGLSPERLTTARVVSYGSVVSLRHDKTHHLLHSHPLFYQVGSGQQQVTAVDTYDSDCFWYIEKAFIEEGEPAPHMLEEQVMLTNDSHIRLLHSQTMRRLHSHNITAPVTVSELQFEVSCYGAEMYPGDANDIWIIEPVDPDSHETINGEILALESHFRLKHSLLGCYLITHNKKLPAWAYSQMEVTCAYYPTLEVSLWTIEYNMKSNMSSLDYSQLTKYPSPNIFEKSEECMNFVNNELEFVPKASAASRVDSQFMLPLLPKPEVLVMWGDQAGLQVASFGNITVWALSLTALLMYLLGKLIFSLALQRGYKPKLQRPDLVIGYDHNIGRCVASWLVLFISLFYAKTEIRLSSYMPCLYMTMLVFLNIWDYLLNCYASIKSVRIALQLLVVSLVVKNYVDYRPMSIGLDWTREACESASLGIWDFNCDLYSKETLNRIVYEADQFEEDYMGCIPSDYFEGDEGKARIAASQSYVREIITTMNIPEEALDLLAQSETEMTTLTKVNMGS